MGNGVKFLHWNSYYLRENKATFSLAFSLHMCKKFHPHRHTQICQAFSTVFLVLLGSIPYATQLEYINQKKRTCATAADVVYKLNITQNRLCKIFTTLLQRRSVFDLLHFEFFATKNNHCYMPKSAGKYEQQSHVYLQLVSNFHFCFSVSKL